MLLNLSQKFGRDMTYRLEITSRAQQCMVDIVEYLYYAVGGVGNPRVATKFLSEYEMALSTLARQAGSYAFCAEDGLRQHGYRRIRLKTLNYKIFYRVVNDAVIIDLITHDSQDYMKLL